MRLNIVDMVIKTIGSQLSGPLTRKLGVGSNIVERGISGAIPGVLSGVSRSAQSPEGAGALDGALKRADPSTLDNLGDHVARPGADDEHIGELSSIMGRDQVSDLTSKLGNRVGLSGGKAKSIVAAVAPAVMGILAKVKRSNNLDRQGMARFLSDQKENIQNALSSSETPREEHHPRHVGRPEREHMGRPVEHGPRKASWLKWAAPLVLLALLLGLGYHFLTKGRDQQARQVQEPERAGERVESIPGR